MNDYKYDLAVQYYKQGRNDAAIELLKEILAEDVDDAMSHGLLAGCLLSKKRLYAARYEINIALQLEPNEPLFTYYLAQIQLLENKRKEALSLCDEVLALDPKYYQAFLLQSDIYILNDERKKAYAAIRRASSIEPDNIDVILKFAEYYLGSGDNKKAETNCRTALSMSAENEDANILMGKIRLDQGNIAEAEYHAKFSLVQNPESEQALRLFSDIKMRKNFFIGTWWRVNSWISKLGDLKACLVLITAYIGFNLLAQILLDMGYIALALITSYTWLTLVVYSWVGIPLYYRMLRKELDQFSFKDDF